MCYSAECDVMRHIQLDLLLLILFEHRLALDHHKPVLLFYSKLEGDQRMPV
jgi:hypothetical protein